MDRLTRGTLAIVCRLLAQLNALRDRLDPPPVFVALPTPDPEPEPLPDPAIAVTRALMDQAQTIHIDGEARRHQVYAALIKRYPDRRKRDLALLIETVQQGRP